MALMLQTDQNVPLPTLDNDVASGGVDGSLLQKSSLLQKCSPNINIAFIKLHRVGSGSFHNVLVRFAINHNAFVALHDCPNYQIFPLQVSPSRFLPRPRHPKFKGYNMFIDHAAFNKTKSDLFLPNNVLYISQVREPFTQAFSVYHHYKRYFNHTPYAELLTDPDKYEEPVELIGACEKRNCSVTRNFMALEFGYRDQEQGNITHFREFLRKLDKEVYHMSILEDLSASHILLRHKLCWDFKDLLYLKTHRTDSGPKNLTLEKAQREVHRKWSSLDYILYEHFLERHRREIAKQPPSFQAEVKQLEQDQQRFSAFCENGRKELAKNVTNIKRQRRILKREIVFEKSEFYDTYSASYKDCIMLQMTEVEAKAALKFHMNPNVCKNHVKVQAKRQKFNIFPHHLTTGHTMFTKRQKRNSKIEKSMIQALTEKTVAERLNLNCTVRRHVIPGLTAEELGIFQGQQLKQN